jgi:hypothetical protein
LRPRASPNAPINISGNQLDGTCHQFLSIIAFEHPGVDAENHDDIFGGDPVIGDGSA